MLNTTDRQIHDMTLVEIYSKYGTEGHMAVYGPVCHQKNIIWTEASDVHIIFFWPTTSNYIEVTRNLYCAPSAL